MGIIQEHAKVTSWQEYEESAKAFGVFTFRVPNFVRYLTPNDSTPSAFGLTSNEFVVGPTAWRLVLFPRGDPEDHMALWLVFLPPTFLPPQASAGTGFRITLVNRGDPAASISVESSNLFSARSFHRRFDAVVSRSTLLAQQDSFIPDGELHLRVELHTEVQHLENVQASGNQIHSYPRSGQHQPDARTGYQTPHSTGSSGSTAASRACAPREGTGCTFAQCDRIVALTLTGCSTGLCKLSPIASAALTEVGGSSDVREHCKEGCGAEAGLVSVTFQLPVDLLKQFIVLRASLQMTGSGIQPLTMPQADIWSDESWPFAELLGCVIEMHSGNAAFKAYIDQQSVAATRVLAAAKYYGHQEAVSVLCAMLRQTLTADPKRNVLRGYNAQARIEDLDLLSADLLAQVLSSAEQAVQLLLTPRTLASWLLMQCAKVVDLMAISLGDAELLRVLEAFQFMIALEVVRLNCGELDTRRGYHILAQGFHKAAKCCLVRKLHLKGPSARVPRAVAVADGRYDAEIALGIVGVMSALRTTLQDLYVVTGDGGAQTPVDAGADGLGPLLNLIASAPMNQSGVGPLGVAKLPLLQQATDMLALTTLVWNGESIL